MKNLFLVGLFFISVGLFAQKPGPKNQSANSGSFHEHKVVAKESFYSIGRKYNLSPKEIASFNNLDLEKGLMIGQVIKIPGAANNQKEEKNTGKSEVLTPRNHTILKGETLFKIANKYKISVAELKKMNKMTNDKIEPGASLIVGFIKTAPKPAKSENIEIKQSPSAENSTQEKPAAQYNEPAKVATLPVKKEIPQKPTDPNAGYGNSKSSASTPKRPEHEELIFPNGEIPAEGAFTVLYSPSSAKASESIYINKVGDVATFKSTSGWQDKKYYALINDVEPGTILKITSLENKVIYAKVLGNMPEMKENKGLLLRLSNSAASALGIIDPKFTVQVSFFAVGE